MGVGVGEERNLLECTTSVKFCQTGFSYEIAIQECSRVVKTKTEISWEQKAF